MLQQTTSLRKIAGLKKKIRAIRGGQGSAKTISILILLINHASRVTDREILIISSELTKMRLTVIKDFIKVMKMAGIYEETRMIAGTLYRFPNGSFVKFIGLDKSDVGKGLRSHVAYFNEVNKIDAESYRQVASRTGQIYLDYNPDAPFFVDMDIIPREDCDFLQLTFEDNELLPEWEREEIINYFKLGYNEDGTIKNKYWANLWQVYGLGNIGSIEGVVFEDWEVMDLPSDARLICNGVDFGYSNSKFASLNIYKWNEHYILDELVYKTKLTNADAAEEMYKNGYIDGTVTYCDYAEPKSIEELRRCGIKAIECESKNDIKSFAVKRLNQKTFYVTKRSTNLQEELMYLVYDEKTGKIKKSEKDHLTDALLYAVGSEGKYDGRYFA